MSILTPIKNKLIEAGILEGTVMPMSDNEDDVVLSTSGTGGSSAGTFVKLVTTSQTITLPQGHGLCVIYLVSPGKRAQAHPADTPNTPQDPGISSTPTIQISGTYPGAVSYGVRLSEATVDVGDSLQGKLFIYTYNSDAESSSAWQSLNMGFSYKYKYPHGGYNTTQIITNAENNIAIPGDPGFILSENEAWATYVFGDGSASGEWDTTYPLEYKYGDAIPFLNISANDTITTDYHGYIPKNSIYDSTVFGLGGNTLGDLTFGQTVDVWDQESHTPGTSGSIGVYAFMNSVLGGSDQFTVTITLPDPIENDFGYLTKDETNYPEYYFGPGRGAALIASAALP